MEPCLLQETLGDGEKLSFVGAINPRSRRRPKTPRFDGQSGDLALGRFHFIGRHALEAPVKETQQAASLGLDPYEDPLA